MGPYFRWILFALYLTLFFTFPLALLWDLTGVTLGALLAISFLFLTGYRGTERLAQRLRVAPLGAAEVPTVYAAVEEYCRRLKMDVPRLGIIETPAVNFAALGFSRRHYVLVLTRGALDLLSREELSALIGRQLVGLWYGDFFTESWLSQCLAMIDRVVAPEKTKGHSRRIYPYKLFLRRGLLYPLTLFPSFLLKGSRDPGDLDMRCIRLTQKPRALAEGLRRLEALRDRIPCQFPFSTRHLFLVPPPSRDPLARLFMASDSMADRIRAVESLQRLVPLT
jgi:Zn-dependent protease with chaperone function